MSAIVDERVREEVNEAPVNEARDSQARLIDDLRRVPLFAPFFSHLNDEQVQCLPFLQQGEEIRLRPGERIVSEDDAGDFYVVLDGDLHVLKKVNGQEMLIATHHPGAFFGELPLLLDTTFFATGQAVGECRVFRLQQEAFWSMLSSCPSITREILRTLAQRTQNLETIAQGREKLASLGTMAAGLAHELNNPASASRRAAKELRETARTLPIRACCFSKQHLEAAQLEFISGLQRDLAERAANTIPLDPLVSSDREDELTTWLDEHGVAAGWQLASTLVEADVNLEWLETFAAHLPQESLGDVLNWIVATLTVDSLVQEIDQSTTRLADLVKAVKSYSYMDQAPLQEVDVHEGLESTLTLLSHKLKGIDVTRRYDTNLPRISAYGSELNQVWTNLLDNAIDAVAGNPEGSRHICVGTARENGSLLVEIADNGTGIPPDVQAHIFEPFFTTKAIGQGTGLGLGISHRIVVGRHGGDMSVTSRPGDTHFQVRLPLESPAQEG